MDAIYYLGGFIALVLTIAFIPALIRPSLFGKVLGRFATRKHIIIGSVALFILLGSLLSATEPASVKQARLAKENASKQTTSQSINAPAQDTKAIEGANTEKKELQEKQPIPFSKVQKNDPSLASGKTLIAQAGKNGEKTLTYEVVYVDGKETLRTLKSDEITLAAVDEITSVGTYVAPVAAPKPSTPAPTQNSGVRTGATCKDGTHSNATGSGACSHHGGVAYWLYN